MFDMIRDFLGSRDINFSAITSSDLEKIVENRRAISKVAKKMGEHEIAAASEDLISRAEEHLTKS